MQYNTSTYDKKLHFKETIMRHVKQQQQSIPAGVLVAQVDFFVDIVDSDKG
jgi:hypothetical protein